MRLAIMQPYFLPYIGYFQLIGAVDRFIVYDNIKYTKKGWINRNRMLRNGEDVTFSLPLKAGADHLDVCERELAADFSRDKLLAQFDGAYRRAPHFAATFALLQDIVGHADTNLFGYLHHGLRRMCSHLGLSTDLRVSSDIAVDHTLKAEHKVLALCGAAGAQTYINSMGGQSLYDKDRFAQQGVELRFLQPRAWEYPQFGAPFVPWLSIVDVLMFNDLDTVRARVGGHYDLL